MTRRFTAGLPLAARIAAVVVVVGSGVGVASFSAKASLRGQQPAVPAATQLDAQAATATARLASTLRLPHAGRPETITHPDADHAAASAARPPGPARAPVHSATAQTSTHSASGLDVSSYQGNVDWAQVAASGGQFAYAKASEGTSYISPYFSQQYQGAAGQGLIRGAYHFAIPDNSAGAAQADFFTAHGGAWSADNHTLPGMVDIEYNPYGSECYGLSPTQMVAWVTSFVNEYHADTGRWAVIYTTTDWWSTCTGNSASFAAQDPLWIANYSSSPYPLPAGWASYVFWQNADRGVFPGDQDVFIGPPAQLLALANNNPVTSYYAQLGGSGSYLGEPTDSPHPVGGGEAQDFGGGSIYWSAGTGAHAVHGAILYHYLALGGPTGFLGFPVTDENGTPDGIGRYNHFSNNGSIYWTPATGAWSVHGAIRDRWAALGWERSALGYPTSDEYAIPGGRQNTFVSGRISWSRSTGATTVAR